MFSETGNTLHVDVEQDFSGGLTIAASVFKVTLNRMANRGVITRKKADQIFDEAFAALREAIDTANFVTEEE
jgi:hypothetical protein